ncbi:MAG: response regulator [Chloroflexota bacterium]
MTVKPDKRHKFTILIIDDDLNQLKTLADLLKLEQLRPICCQTGQQALNVCRTQTVNVAILDIQIPDSNGVDLLKALKAENPAMKIIINTAHATLESAIDAINEEVFAYLQKTEDTEALISHVYRAFHAHLASYSEDLEAEVQRRTEELLQINQELIKEIRVRKQIEDRLAEEHNLLRTFIDNVPDYMFVKDRQSRFRLCNEATVRLMGASTPDELIGKTDFDYFPQDLASQYYAGEQSIIESGLPMVNNEEVSLNVSQGIVSVHLTTKIPLQDATGAIIGIVGIARDITAHKHLEDQLRQAQKMEAVGQLTAGIAHDFNNLLTAINGFAELIQRKLSASDPLIGLVNKISDSGERASNLVNQLMAFSRKQVLDPKVLHLNNVIQQVDEMLQRIIGEHIELRTNLLSDLWLIKADPAQLEQVIINLAVNARDAMPHGGSLTIQTTNIVINESYVANYFQIRPGQYVQLSMSDVGVGMNETLQERIFEPFFTTKSPGSGTGLGLSTVYGIIKQNGGDIEVNSQEGKGSTFKIYLPQVDEAYPKEQPVKPITEMPTGNETILLVEDEEGVRHLALSVLQMQGYEVLEAQSGEEALRLSSHYQSQIHLLLTDVVMPQMNGKVIAEQLSQIRPQLKVLYMSGYADDTITQHDILSPDVAFLKKPFNAMTLARKIRQVLDAPPENQATGHNPSRAVNE